MTALAKRIACAFALIPLASACDGGGVTGSGPGKVSVTVTTSGTVPDQSGYTVNVGGSTAHVGPNGTVTLESSGPADVKVTLDGLAANCDADGGLTRTVTVKGGQTTDVQYAINCQRNGVAFLAPAPGRTDLYAQFGNDAPVLLAQGVSPARVQWSADGRRVAYSAFRPGRAASGIYSVDIDSMESVLMPVGEAYASHAAWSPDGNRLAFISAFQLRVMNVDGSASQQLYTDDVMFDPHMPVWSPDGQWIAFTGIGSGTFSRGVYLARPDGTELRRLVDLQFTGYAHLAWSPDGTRLVYEEHIQNGAELFTVTLATGAVTRVTDTPAFVELYPTFLRDGRIGYSRTDNGGMQAHTLWTVGVDGSGAAQYPVQTTGPAMMPAWQ